MQYYQIELQPSEKGGGKGNRNSSCELNAKHSSKHFYIECGNASRVILEFLFYEGNGHESMKTSENDIR